jgi:hypothetical protein
MEEEQEMAPKASGRSEVEEEEEEEPKKWVANEMY